MATEITAAGTAVEFQEFKIDVPLSPVGLAPSATVELPSDAITANDPVTITIDGDVAFDGTCQRVEIDDDGLRTAQCRHPGTDLMQETVTFTQGGTDEDVLRAALGATDRGGSFTLTFNGTTSGLANDYDADDKPLKRVFRDMMDRGQHVWWIDPASRTITVEDPGGRGQWQAIDVGSDAATLKKFDRGSVDSVRNKVTVVGTGFVEIRTTLTDQQSIDEYGVQPAPKPYNYDYITDPLELSEMADRLIISDPLPTGKVAVGRQVGDIVQPLANYTVDLTDASKGIDATDLVVEKQTIRQGRATVTLGEGAGVNFEDVNRSQKSGDENAQPGSVYDSDRIADDAVNQLKLADGSVLEDKLADAAVATAKLQNNAVINGKLADLSVSETKVQDDSISTPKLVAEAVTANEIAADTITAAEIAAGTITALEIAADTITADQIAADTLTAKEIDTLDLDTGELSIGQGQVSAGRYIEFEITEDDLLNDRTVMVPNSGGTCLIGTESRPFGDGHIRELFSLSVDPESDNSGNIGNTSRGWGEVWAYDYFDASTESTINDGGDPLAGLAEGHGPPAHCERCDDETGETVGYSLTDMARSVWDVVRAQQGRIEAQQERIDALEERLSALEAQQ